MPSNPPSPADLWTAVRGLAKQPLYCLLLVVPLTGVLTVVHASNLWIFLSAGLAIVPLAAIMGRATENLSEALGPGIGGLLNATFGNAAELLIALMLLAKGPAMYPLVKASITGSIVGNILLVLGMATLLGGLAHQRQVFNRTYAGMGATLLALASIGLLVPSFHSFLLAVQKGQEERLVQSLSVEIAVILAVIYVLSLVFSLWTGRRISAGPEAELPTMGEHHRPEWNRRCSLTLLLIATAGVAAMSELLADSVDDVGHALGLNQVFMGVIVVSIIGNAAEQSTAVLMAMKNKMDLTMHITIGSAIQMALFVAPVLLFASMLMGHSRPLDLHFSLLEMVTMILAVGVLALVSQDGESNWMEGVLLLGVYLILALAFYHLPGGAE